MKTMQKHRVRPGGHYEPAMNFGRGPVHWQLVLLAPPSSRPEKSARKRRKTRSGLGFRKWSEGAAHRASRKWPRRLRQTGKATAVVFLLGVIAFAGAWAAFPFPVERLQEAQSSGSPLILDREGGLVAWRVDACEQWRLPVGIEDVSPWMAMATIAAEDKRFRSHMGVDLLAIGRAAWQNASCRRRVSGASTISMQTIRLLWPRRRTLGAKCIEAFRAVQLEATATKDDILELYLNLAPYGGNVVGVEAASRRYFRKRAAELSLGEAALLAGLPQRPGAFNPEKHLERALERREFVFERMVLLGLASQEDIRAARLEPIRIEREMQVADAPRFADAVLARRRGEGGIIRTTLDTRVQAGALEAVRDRAGALSAMGIDGTAVVVVDVRRSELLAMVGSSDPSDPRAGCVNGATSLRQPGSLLKPFIYAAAFDSGELTPQSVVYDLPTSWAGYRPDNMDKEFLGPVSAARALSASRNLPAVRLLGRLGAQRLAHDANRLGLRVSGAEQRCGLSLALGTAEVRLVDIAGAYAALARLGEYRPLRFLCGEEGARSERVYSQGGAYLVLRCLGASEPGEPFRPACKTGTSWGHRDAWAVVMTPDVVVGVWCGRLSGQGHPALTGAGAALPLAMDVLGRVWKPGDARWPRPDTVRSRSVCSLSGSPAGAVCPETLQAEYLPGVSREVPCSLHRFVADGGVRKVATVWPGDVASLLEHEEAAQDAQPPSIEVLSPMDDGEYVIAELGGKTLDLTARTSGGASHIYWFLDGELLARAEPGQPVAWSMHPGEHELTASSGSGASRCVRFKVVQIDSLPGR